MSEFKVPLTFVQTVKNHPNADRLDIVKIYDWEVVTQRGRYKPHDFVLYIPVDSILPRELEDKLFPPDSKIKLNNHRIRSIKLRGQISQGMIVDPHELLDDRTLAGYSIEADLSEKLGIKKYEPEEKSLPAHMQMKSPKKNANHSFRKYVDIENAKNYLRIFIDGEEVYISEKLHGTSARFGYFPTEVNTLRKRVLKFFGQLPEYEFCWGSRNVQIQMKGKHEGFYDIDLYTKISNQYDLKQHIPKGFGVYGEIVGDGVQKGYTYGCGRKEHKFYVYDVWNHKEGRWLNYEEFDNAVNSMGLEKVPKLYVGPYSKEIVDKLRTGDSEVTSKQKVREGIVVKPVVEEISSIGRKILKFINDDYYLKQAQEDGTEFH